MAKTTNQTGRRSFLKKAAFGAGAAAAGTTGDATGAGGVASGAAARVAPPAQAERTSSTDDPVAFARASAERFTMSSGALSAWAAVDRRSLIDLGG